MNDNLEIIRKAAIAANPEKEWVYFRYEGGTESTEYEEPIRLADVLLAISLLPPPCNDYLVSTIGWNLRRDDLAEQSEETLAFLADLLK